MIICGRYATWLDLIEVTALLWAIPLTLLIAWWLQ